MARPRKPFKNGIGYTDKNFYFCEEKNIIRKVEIYGFNKETEEYTISVEKRVVTFINKDDLFESIFELTTARTQEKYHD